MCTSSDAYRNKYRYSLSTKIGPACGNSGDNKLIMATAIAIGLNRGALELSSGLVLRGHRRYHSIVASHSVDVKPHIRKGIAKNTTNWLICISPKLEHFSITEDRKIGPKLDESISNVVKECANEIQKEWRK